MAEARINPEQLQEAVQASLKRALERDPRLISRPILVGIIAYPDGDRVDFRDIQAVDIQAADVRAGK